MLHEKFLPGMAVVLKKCAAGGGYGSKELKMEAECITNQ